MLESVEKVMEIATPDQSGIEMPESPARSRRYRRRPLKAWRHFRKLIANKEDTEQVFHIIQALNGKAVIKKFTAFKASEDGRERLKQKRDLPAILDDHARWEALEQGTLGRAYVDFMKREGLTAQGLVDEYEGFARQKNEELDPDILWYGWRLRDTHDLCHVLTDYGRDAMGEACVLSFSYGQNRGLGVIFIAILARFEIRKRAPKGAPIFRAIWQGLSVGNKARKVARQDIIALMEEPLDVVRQRLGIKPPSYYPQIHAMFRAQGVDPYGVNATS